MSYSTCSGINPSPTRQQRPNYETWLNQIVAVYQTHLDNKDRTFSRFLLDLPAVPSDILSLLREMSVEQDRYV
jgi:symplekin